ncbi:leucine-rich repeat domain-containing protein [Dyadobacter sp. CY343]|uniref:leucine-rich repeat domain-containing protein n=1 Tax=Dyadobacter sp. CY343 TaxID=2907299 RepID=UPI001F1D7D9E|nr:leucine-rich repeat domain-containing protein [Dyadobacter sp. CY343]MCE7059071.1 leucine-rich repeat domain-containing protein [Dyadobacter sp. CY343]
MKFFLTIIFVTGYLLAVGQPVIVSSHSEEGKRLQKKLGPDFFVELGVIEVPHSTVHNFSKACADIMAAEKYKDVYAHGSAVVNKQGKPEYFFVSVTSPFQFNSVDKTNRTAEFDSLANVLATHLRPFVESFISKRTIGRKTVVTMSSTAKIQAVARSTRDSTISAIDALSEMRDTLGIKYISLSKSLLNTIPAAIYRFPNVEALLLSDNDIEAVELDLSRLPKLKQIDLTGNILRDGSIRLSKNKSLKMLMLQKNQLNDIPAAVKRCKGLEMLWLGSNSLSKLSNKSFRRAKSVLDLNFYKSGLAVLPKGIKKMKRLEVLDLYYNNLKSLPKTITKLRNLTHLAIAHNQIEALPADIEKLSKIHTLYAHHNHLSKLPESFNKMKNLKLLDLGYNWFVQFPEPLTSFVNLQELDLSSNNFQDFPEQLLQIQKLERLHLRGNPFLKPGSDIIYSKQLSVLKDKNIEVFY